MIHNENGIGQYSKGDARRPLSVLGAIYALDNPTISDLARFTGYNKGLISSYIRQLQEQFQADVVQIEGRFSIRSWGSLITKEGVLELSGISPNDCPEEEFESPYLDQLGKLILGRDSNGMVTRIITGRYPTDPNDGYESELPYSGYVRCKDQQGLIIVVSADEETQSITVHHTQTAVSSNDWNTGSL